MRPKNLAARDLAIGDRVTVRHGLRLETRTVDVVSYRKSSVSVTFTDDTIRSYPNNERLVIK